MRDRLREIDYMKAIVALSVVAIHVSSTYTRDLDIAYIWNVLMRYSIPVFIILSGFALHYSHKDILKESYFGFMKHRAIRIIIPYILWTGIYFIFYRYILGILEIKGGWLKYLFDCIFLGAASDQLYFIPIIIQLYFLYPLLKYLLKNYHALTFLGSLLITLYFQIIIFQGDSGLTLIPIFGLSVVQRISLFFPATWIFFFVFGMDFVINKDKWIEKLSRHKINVLMAWIFSFAILLVESKYTKVYTSSAKPTIMIFSIITFVLLYLVMISVKDSVSKVSVFFQWIGKQSFLLFLCHLVVLVCLRNYIYKIKLLNIWDNIDGMFTLYIFTVALSLALVYIISLLPIASLLGGVRKKRFYTKTDVATSHLNHTGIEQ